MLALGGFMIAAGELRLPMPGFRARERQGPLAVLTLGAFSGVASACCAPVLAGVLVLNGRPLFYGRLSERRLRKALATG